jgi:hypothetical protein
MIDKGTRFEQRFSKIPGCKAAADYFYSIHSGPEVLAYPEDSLGGFLPVKDQTDVGGAELFQVTVESCGHPGLVVEGQVQHADRDIFLAQVVTHPEGPHGNMDKIGTGAVYDKKPGLHIESLGLIFELLSL